MKKQTETILLNHIEMLKLELKSLRRHFNRAKKSEIRYNYWRARGIAISDGPTEYLCHDELDKYTDKRLDSL